MNGLAVLLKLKYLKNMKALGFDYMSPLESFDTLGSNELPNDMNKLRNMCSGCHLCDLAKSRKSVVFGAGNETADIMFVGEAPGESEDNLGKPFVGKAGEMLTKMIENVLEIPRSSVYIANIAKCRPPQNRTPSHLEIAACKPYILKQIELVKPKIIVALGATALNTLISDELQITKARGKQYKFGNAVLVPTFHPSYLLRNPNEKKHAMEDMKLIKSLIN